MRRAVEVVLCVAVLAAVVAGVTAFALLSPLACLIWLALVAVVCVFIGVAS